MSPSREIGNRRRWPRSVRQARAHATLVAAVLWPALIVTLAVGSSNRSIAGPIKGTDFLQFYASGYLARTHQAAALYDMGALHRAQVALVPESSPEHYPPVYPPQAALLFAPFSLLPYQGALFLWIGITLLGFALIVRSAWRSVATSLPDSRFVVVAVASFPPFWSLVLHGQATILVLAAFWAGWAALERRRPFVAGLFFGALLLKPQFGIPLAAVVLLCGEWWIVLGALASIAAQIAAVALLVGTQVIGSYARFVPVMLSHADLLEAKPYLSHSVRALTRLAPDWIGVPLWLVASALVIAAAVRAWRSGLPLGVRMGIVIFASVLVNPHLIIYDATVLVLPLIWCGAYFQDVESPDRARAYWMLTYWLSVTLLVPTSAAIGVQASVLLMIWIFAIIVPGRTPGGAAARSDRALVNPGG